MQTRIACAALLTAAITACGGGGGNGSTNTSSSTSTGGDSTPPTVILAGLWTGTTSAGRNIWALTFQDGGAWLIYTRTGSTDYAGLVQGTMNGAATDFHLEGSAVTSVSLAASGAARQSIAGTTSTGGQAVSFSGTYNTRFEQTANLATLAGIYSGAFAFSGSNEVATMTILPGGTLSGLSASGCSYTGTVTARTDANAYNMTITFAGGPCVQGTGTVSGVAVLESNGSLTAAAINATRTSGLLFSGI